MTADQLPGIIEQMQRRLRQPRYRPHAAEVWAATGILLGLRYPEGLIQELLRRGTGMKESTFYQAILKEGMAEGRVEGRAEGRLAEAKRLLLVMGANTLGPADAHTLSVVEALDDVQRVEDLAVRLHAVGSWQELLGNSGSRRRRSRKS